MANSDIQFEVRSMRDTISHLLEDMVYKAGLANTSEVDDEVTYALRSIGYQVSDSLGAVRPKPKKPITKTEKGAMPCEQ